MSKKEKKKPDTSILEGRKYSKSNALVNAKGKSSLLGHKLFAVGLQQMSLDEKTGELESTLYGTDLRQIFGKENSGSFYEQIKELVEPVKGKESFMDYRFVYSDDTTKKIEAYNLVTGCTFENGVLNIKYNKAITDQIYELKSNYTVYALSETMQLKSLYSFRLYEILKAEYDYQAHGAKKMGMTVDNNTEFILEINLTDLKLRLGIIDPTANKEILKAIKKVNPDYDEIEELADSQKDNLKYAKYSNFKRLCLERPKKELAEKTKLSFEYKEQTNGRGGKVVGIRFFIKFKRNNSEQEVNVLKEVSEEQKENVLDEIIEIIDEKLKLKEYRAIAEAANYNTELIKKQYEALEKKGTDIKNLVGYLISAVREDYETNVKKKLVENSFNNFEQNTYDFEELEKKILDN